MARLRPGKRAGGRGSSGDLLPIADLATGQQSPPAKHGRLVGGSGSKIGRGGGGSDAGTGNGMQRTRFGALQHLGTHAPVRLHPSISDCHFGLPLTLVQRPSAATRPLQLSHHSYT